MASYPASSREPGRAPVPIDARTDYRWMIEPALTVLTLLVFGAYAAFRAFENHYYSTAGLLSDGVSSVAPLYLSPFYSPPLNEYIANWPPGLSVALFVTVFPLSFRATCYYCRKAYYRSFFLDPPACAVAELRARSNLNYTGETKFPFVLNNLHRYALYFILIYVGFHWYHLYEAFHYRDARGMHFGIGVGTLVLGLDAVLLSLYVFSCHSWRHLIGGGMKRLSSNPLRHRLWKGFSKLNARHGLWFWLSLISVGFADLYVRMVASGAIADFRFF